MDLLYEKLRTGGNRDIQSSQITWGTFRDLDYLPLLLS